ncbi:hypothetical protein J6590_016096 [Homalodisca vitripennis]|nr:hypothetical protein J6590_016096 [Homalodisca vitripennis]
MTYASAGTSSHQLSPTPDRASSASLSTPSEPCTGWVRGRDNWSFNVIYLGTSCEGVRAVSANASEARTFMSVMPVSLPLTACRHSPHSQLLPKCLM